MYTSYHISSISSSFNLSIFFIKSSYVEHSVNISYFSFITSLSSCIFGNNFLIFEIKLDGLCAFPSVSLETYDKYNFSSAVVNALYILKLSSYNLSIVPFASSIPFCFSISLSESFKNPTSLF